MVVAHNLTAMNAQRQFNIVDKTRKKSTEKLASGYRINRAADDAAGLAISEKMRRQIRGLTQGANNTMDGISLLQVADGALAEVNDMLHRVTELSVKSANGTNTAEEREAIQQEISQIMSEINRISDTTTFNERLLFSDDTESSITSLSSQDILSKLANDTYPAIAADITLPDGTVMDTSSANMALSLLSDIAKAYEVFSNGYSLDNNASRFKALWTSLNDNLIHGGSKPYYISSINDAKMKITQYFNGNALNLSDLMTSYNHATTAATGQVEYYKSRSMAEFSQAVIQHNSGSFKDFLTDQFKAFGSFCNGNYTELAYIVCAPFTDADSAMKGVINGYKYICGIPVQANSSQNGDIWIQSGAEPGDGMYITIGNMNTRTLGMAGLDVSTIAGADSAINAARSATQIISELRSNIGAQQNRLEHTYNNVSNVAENTQAAESRIRDTDMAKEMVEMSTNNLLEQVGQSMMAQANQSNRGVLSILQ